MCLILSLCADKIPSKKNVHKNSSNSIKRLNTKGKDMLLPIRLQAYHKGLLFVMIFLGGYCVLFDKLGFGVFGFFVPFLWLLSFLYS